MSLYFDVVIVNILQGFRIRVVLPFLKPKDTHVESDPSSNGHPKADASPKTNKRPFILKSLKSVLVCQVYVLHTIDIQQQNKIKETISFKEEAKKHVTLGRTTKKSRKTGWRFIVSIRYKDCAIFLASGQLIYRIFAILHISYTSHSIGVCHDTHTNINLRKCLRNFGISQMFIHWHNTLRSIVPYFIQYICEKL